MYEISGLCFVCACVLNPGSNHNRYYRFWFFSEGKQVWDTAQVTSPSSWLEPRYSDTRAVHGSLCLPRYLPLEPRDHTFLESFCLNFKGQLGRSRWSHQQLCGRWGAERSSGTEPGGQAFTSFIHLSLGVTLLFESLLCSSSRVLHVC